MSRTSLTKYAPLMREPDPAVSHDLRTDAFHREGIVCISLKEMEEKHGWLAAKQLRLLGEQMFGRKR